MPIYAYRCEACGHAKDVLQKFSDPLLTTCPSCGAEAFKKQVTAAGFQLKGSGWYVTDFRGDSKAGKPAVEGAAGTSAKGEGGKTESTAADAGKSESGAADKSKSEPSTGKSDSAGAKTTASPAPAAAPTSGSGSGGAGSAAGGQ